MFFSPGGWRNRFPAETSVDPSFSVSRVEFEWSWVELIGNRDFLWVLFFRGSGGFVQGPLENDDDDGDRK